MRLTTASAPADGNRSLLRGLAVLDSIGRHAQAGVRVSELVRDCQLERATIYRLLATLVACGRVVKRGRFHYMLGAAPATRAASPVDQLAARLGPLLQRISDTTGDAAFAVVREGTQSHCIARHIGSFPLQVLAVRVGRRQPLGVGAAGLALLASLAPAEARAIVEANASALPAYGGMTADRLNLLLKATRERGWSVVGNHVVADALGVGLALLPSDVGMPVAVSVAAPMDRMSAKRQLFIVKSMRQALADMVGKRRHGASH